MYPEKLTPHLEALTVDSHAIAAMFRYDEREKATLDYELADPLGEGRYAVAGRAVHQYPDRLLVHVTGLCAAHCRYCFRRTGAHRTCGPLDERSTGLILGYLKGHNQIKEVLLSGGDPFTMGTDQWEYLLKGIRQARPDITLRIGTRMPVSDPARFEDNRLMDLLADHGAAWIMTHINHPDELTAETRACLERLRSNGLSLANQTVLLKGVNDEVPILAGLFTSLVGLGVKPYYLFQGDLAMGTAHFRVPLSRSLAIVNELRRHVSGLAMPVFAVDIPGGGGKVPLSAPWLGAPGKKGWPLTHPDGHTGFYPEEPEEPIVQGQGNASLISPCRHQG